MRIHNFHKGGLGFVQKLSDSLDIAAVAAAVAAAKAAAIAVVYCKSEQHWS